MQTTAVIGAVALLTTVLGAGSALAASSRTFVSGKGTDKGSCAIATPCRSFAYAITQTSPSGEILVLDSAGYGPVTIAQSVSIVAPPGIEGSITAPSSGAGISINAGTSDAVLLQGLTIDGQSSGNDGIDFNSGGTLKIAACHVRNLSFDGILIAAPNALYSITNTEVAKTGNIAIAITNQNGGGTNGVISSADIHDNATGVYALQSITTITSSIISGNVQGVTSSYQATILLGGSVVVNNKEYGIYNQEGIIGSYGDNYISANSTDVQGNVTAVSKR